MPALSLKHFSHYGPRKKGGGWGYQCAFPGVGEVEVVPRGESLAGRRHVTIGVARREVKGGRGGWGTNGHYQE